MDANTLLYLALAVLAAFVLARRLRSRKASPVLVMEKIRSGAKIVDVRTPGEFAGASYPKAKNIPLDALSSRMGRATEGQAHRVVLRLGSAQRPGRSDAQTRRLRRRAERRRPRRHARGIVRRAPSTPHRAPETKAGAFFLFFGRTLFARNRRARIARKAAANLPRSMAIEAMPPPEPPRSCPSGRPARAWLPEALSPFEPSGAAAELSASGPRCAPLAESSEEPMVCVKETAGLELWTMA